MTDNRATRALRAAVFTALAVPLAALGQVVITGRALPLTLVAAASLAVFLLALVLDGARHRFLQVSAVLVPVELLLNTVFNLGQDACTTAAPSHGVNLLVCGGDSVGGSSLFADWTGRSTGSLQLLVLAVHLVLALVAAAWLRLGQAALTGVGEAVRALHSLLPAPWRALLLSAVPACPAALRPAPERAEAALRPQAVLLTPAPRRGPPALALAC
ncbi:hypothetical protein GCM10010441_60280 [Kitasatospora paracochleata]|uniref:Integral membrane protein n=1 Tax=Kitasatospora paracochleata TaxID=58354 RepID=A0ABT1IVS9_9ACTN|nr:hypothetical protein [Kitasatospora paracochleata]MCP2309074.1 hypothetical protein [Kitasatospora paracochleata]